MILNYKILGEHGPVLAIIHGLFGSMDNWQTLARKFSGDRIVLLIDQRNHGSSDHSDYMDYQLMADDLKETLDDLDLHIVDLLGHSMGGKTVMRFAIDHPDYVHDLIVADIGPKEYPPHHELIIEAMEAVKPDELKSRGEADEILAEYLSDAGVRQFLAKNLYWRDKGILDWRFNLLVLAGTLENILAPIDGDYDKEVLFIRGEKSDYIKDEDYLPIKEQFPHAHFEEMINVGHWLHAEDPESFFHIVQSYLNRSSGMRS